MFRHGWKLIDHRDTHDSALNLAIEEYAVRRLDPAYSYLFLYVNDPAVILGRHQNVLQEVNLPLCWQEGVPVHRRISGGGTVVHDAGNLNFTFITRHTLKNFNQYRRFLQPIVRVLNELGAEAVIDRRNNLRIGQRKISGNAQFTSRNRMLSHGTLLFDADLARLRRLLSVNPDRRIETRASRSVRSAVTNVRPHLKRHVTIEELRQAIVHEILGSNAALYVFNEREWAEIESLAQSKYERFEWNIGQSPPCTVQVLFTFGQQEISFGYALEEGLFRDFEISDRSLQFLKKDLIHKPLSRETLNNLRKQTARIPDAILREKAEKVLEKLV